MSRNTLLGAAAAAAIIVLLIVLSRLLPGSMVAQRPVQPTGPTPEQIAASAARITPGFVGTAAVGNWSVSCAAPTADESAKIGHSAPIPFTLNASGTHAVSPPAPATTTRPDTAKPDQPNELKFGRCRAALLVRSRNNPRSVALVAVFRLMEDSSDVALILHVPPVLKPGSKVLVALADKQAIGLPVTNCEKGQCIALGVLKPDVYEALAAKPKLAVVVPSQANGQRMIIPLSMSGLPESVAAIRRAG